MSEVTCLYHEELKFEEKTYFCYKNIHRTTMKILQLENVIFIFSTILGQFVSSFEGPLESFCIDIL